MARRVNFVTFTLADDEIAMLKKLVRSKLSPLIRTITMAWVHKQLATPGYVRDGICRCGSSPASWWSLPKRVFVCATCKSNLDLYGTCSSQIGPETSIEDVDLVAAERFLNTYKSPEVKLVDDLRRQLEHQANDSRRQLEHQSNDFRKQLEHQANDSRRQLEHQANDFRRQLERQSKQIICQQTKIITSIKELQELLSSVDMNALRVVPLFKTFVDKLQVRLRRLEDLAASNFVGETRTEDQTGEDNKDENRM